MDRKQPELDPASAFKELRLDEQERLKLAELARMGGASVVTPPEVTFITAQSDTIPVVTEEEKNA